MCDNKEKSNDINNCTYTNNGPKSLWLSWLTG